MRLVFSFILAFSLTVTFSFGQLFTSGVTDTASVDDAFSDNLGFVVTGGQHLSGNGRICRYDPSGNMLWAFMDGAGGTYGTRFKHIRCDASGNIYATGWIGNTAFWNGSTYTASGSTDPFLVKMDPQGNLLWDVAFPGGSSSFEDIFDVYIHPNGDVTALGYAGSSIMLGGSLVTTSGAKPFTATYSSTGTYISGGFASVSTGAVWNGTFDAAGNFYTTSFDNPNQTLTKFDAAGIMQWQTIGNGNSEWWDLAIDNQGNVYAGGSFDGTFSMGGTAFTSVTMWDDLFLFKTDASGNILWMKQFGSSAADNIYDLELNAAGEVLIAGNQGAACTFDQLTTPALGGMDIFLAKVSATGNVLWATSGGNPNVDLEASLALNPLTGKLVMAASASIGLVQFGPVSLSVTNGFWLDILDNACTARGRLFRDWDGNGVQGVGEGGFANRSVRLSPGPLFGFSGPGGDYEIYSNIGSYTIDMPVTPLYHTFSAASSHTASYTALGQFDLGNDFALQPVPNMNDLKVHLTATNYGARQGRIEGYVIQYENIGTTTIPATTISFKYPAGCSFSHAVPGNASVFPGSDSVAWSGGSLAPGQTGYIYVAVSMPTSYPLGAILDLYAHITPDAGDQTPSDNHRHFGHTVVGPYDPNIKQVQPAGDISPAFVANGEYLTYTIHFQNTGNDTAYFVRLVDTLSQNLDLSTFEFLANSHVSSWTISNDRKLTVDYVNIMLPDSFVDEPGSHGFFQYRAKPLSSLVLGDQVQNRAHIYFDFNAPITTNTTVTVVAEPTATEDPSTENNFLFVYPNPASEQVNVFMDQPGIFYAQVMDIQGRPTSDRMAFRGRTSFALGNLSSGMYLLRVTDARGQLAGSKPFIKK